MTGSQRLTRSVITWLKWIKPHTGEGKDMERCKQCKKVLFKKKDGSLVCPNDCDDHHRRSAFNTVIDSVNERRNVKWFFDPWANAR